MSILSKLFSHKTCMHKRTSHVFFEMRAECPSLCIWKMHTAFFLKDNWLLAPVAEKCQLFRVHGRDVPPPSRTGVLDQWTMTAGKAGTKNLQNHSDQSNMVHACMNAFSALACCIHPSVFFDSLWIHGDGTNSYKMTRPSCP
jgi:hypothetical protein